MAGRFEHVGGMTGHFHYAEKKGYSGVGLYTRKTPSDVLTGSAMPNSTPRAATSKCASTRRAES
jgi:exonuclease III